MDATSTPAPEPIRLTTAKYPAMLENVAAETERLLRATLFPDLAPRPGRNELVARLLGTEFGEAFHIVRQLQRTAHLAGDVCEFGVAQGATSALIANEIRDQPKDLWLFDSFAGLPQPSEKDVLIHDIFSLGSMAAYAGKMASNEREVGERLRQIDFPPSRVRLVPGFIERTSRFSRLPAAISFAYVDFDFYEPIKIALDLIHARLPVGGSVIVDDYRFFSAGAEAAVDEFVGRHSSEYEFADAPSWASRFCLLTRV